MFEVNDIVSFQSDGVRCSLTSSRVAYVAETGNVIIEHPQGWMPQPLNPYALDFSKTYIVVRPRFLKLIEKRSDEEPSQKVIDELSSLLLDEKMYIIDVIPIVGALEIGMRAWLQVNREDSFSISLVRSRATRIKESDLASVLELAKKTLTSTVGRKMLVDKGIQQEVLLHPRYVKP